MLKVHASTKPPKELVCPGCGKPYGNYAEYFTCWTGHLDEKIGNSKLNLLAPFEHPGAIKFYRENPQRIEQGLRVIASEVGLFRGRIDLVAADKDHNLVLIDVDNGKDPNRKARQLRRYRTAIQWMGSQIFGLRSRDLPAIRLLIVQPNKSVREVGSMEIHHTYPQKVGTQRGEMRRGYSLLSSSANMKEVKAE